MTQKKGTKSTAKGKKDLATANKATTLQKVVSRRELKYIYPKGMTDPLKRKSFRQKIRNRINRLELQVSKLRGEARKEKKGELAKYIGQFTTV